MVKVGNRGQGIKLPMVTDLRVTAPRRVTTVRHRQVFENLSENLLVTHGDTYLLRRYGSEEVYGGVGRCGRACGVVWEVRPRVTASPTYQ
jgi:hypothetical protein